MRSMHRLTFTALVGLFIAGNAHAGLGGSPTLPAPTVSSVGVQARSLAAVTATTYTVRSSTTTAGIVEREYLNVDGTVFAISWQGPFQPDLRNFMGSDYFNQYSAAVQAAQGNGRRGGAVSISTDNVVAQVGGHQRDFFGRAYVPSLVPNGMSITDIQ